jgi:hypothetical protein
MNKKKLVKVVKNFITNNEIDELNQWTLSNYKQPYFANPEMNNDKSQTRFTTRHSYCRSKEYQNYKVQYPKEVYDIQKRLLNYLKIKDISIAPFPSFTDGICTTIAFPPGSCCKHTDPIYFENTYTLHCNFVTQNPESGGITYVEEIPHTCVVEETSTTNGKLYEIDGTEVPYQFEKNDMIMYVASHVKHRVTEISGDIPRVLWVYGFGISLLEMNLIFNISNISYQ